MEEVGQIFQIQRRAVDALDLRLECDADVYRCTDCQRDGRSCRRYIVAAINELGFAAAVPEPGQAALLAAGLLGLAGWRRARGRQGR